MKSAQPTSSSTTITMLGGVGAESLGGAGSLGGPPLVSGAGSLVPPPPSSAAAALASSSRVTEIRSLDIAEQTEKLCFASLLL